MRTAQNWLGELPENQRRRRHRLDGSRSRGDCSLTAQSVNNHIVQEVQLQNRSLCLKQIIGELEQDFKTRPSLELQQNRFSRSLPNICDLRLTEVALQNATAYKQNSQPLTLSNSFPAIERILKEKINYSRWKWRHYTEPKIYNQMWRSLGKDVHERDRNSKREKALCSGLATHSNEHRKRQQSENKPNLSTQISRPEGKSNKSSWHRSKRHVLPRILLTDWNGKESLKTNKCYCNNYWIDIGTVGVNFFPNNLYKIT